VALRGEWEQHGMADVVAGLLERALENHALAGAAQGGAQAVRMQAHLVLRSALIVAGRCEAAQVHATRALELAGNQPGLRAAALLGQGRQHWERARDAAQVRPLLDEALALARQERAAETEAGVLATRATITFHVDNQPDAAIALFDNAQRLYESQGIDHLANRNLFMKAICHAKLQRYAAALSLLDDCERRFTASGHAAALPELANMQGFVYAYMVRWRDAELAFARCAVVAAGQQNRYMMGFGLWNLARPLAHRRQPEAAARLLAFSERYWVANFDALVPSDRRYLEQVKRLVRVQIGAAALDDAWAAGATLTLPVALEMAAQSLRATG
jgi:tetratricopeptide (TPR) repeat protein